MAEIDLSKLSLADLKKLQKDVEKAVVSFTDRQRSAALAAAEAAARDLGFTLADLIDTKARKALRAKIPAKYQHSDDPLLTWSGRGRKPAWVKQIEETGRSLVDFLIRK